MQNPFDELIAALNQAESVQRVVQDNSNRLARLLTGNLRHVGGYYLRQLKKELADYNMHTGKWKD